MSTALDKAYDAPDEATAVRILVEGGWREGFARQTVAIMFGRSCGDVVGAKFAPTIMECVARDEELERLRKEALAKGVKPD
jgi:hypothetical protein